MSDLLSPLTVEAAELYDEYKLDDLPEALKRDSLRYYYLSVYPSLKEMRDLADDERPAYPETIESAYIHTPYCTGVCDFCSYFLTTVDRDDRAPIDEYYEHLKQEVDFHSKHTDLQLSYLFFGGGTPSLVPPQTLEDFFGHLNEAGIVTPDASGTLELHPELFSRPDEAQALIDVLKANGINRVSLGFQSSSQEILEDTNRRHGVDFLQDAMSLLKANGMLVNLDLMYGLPGLSYASWEKTLQEAVAAEPDSISTYFLFVTPGTVTRREVLQGKVKLPSHAESQIQHIMAQRFLEMHGFLELPSDFYAKTKADPSTFTQDYLPSESASLPIGAGGYGYYSRTQFYNVFDHGEYAQRMSRGESPVWRGHIFSNDSLMHRDVMFSFKNSPHLNGALFEERYGNSPIEAFEKIFDRLIELRLVEVNGKLATLTAAGRLCTEEVCALFRDPSIKEEVVNDSPVTLSRRRKLAKYNFFPDYPQLA